MPPGMRAPGFEKHPFDIGWGFTKSELNGSQIVKPAIIHISEQPSGGAAFWQISVKAFDGVAQKFMGERVAKQGQPIEMGNRVILYVPYVLLDDEADRMLGRAMQPNPDRNPLDVNVWDATAQKHITLKTCTREWFEGLVILHLQRRKAEPAVTLNLGQQQLTVPFEFFDGLCKDFMRRRGDFVAAGWWPELLMHDMGQFSGPKPVDGHANALGHGVNVMTGQPQPPQQGGHPGFENEGVV